MKDLPLAADGYLSPAQLQAPADHFLHHFLHKARHLLTTSFIKPGICWPLPTESQVSADHFLQRARLAVSVLSSSSKGLTSWQTDHRQPQPHVGNPDRGERGTIHPDRRERGTIHPDRGERGTIHPDRGELGTIHPGKVERGMRRVDAIHWTKGTPVPRTLSVSTRRLRAISGLTGQPQTPAGNGQHQLETVNTRRRH